MNIEPRSGAGRQPGANQASSAAATGAHRHDSSGRTKQAMDDTSTDAFDAPELDDDLGAGTPTPSAADVRSDMNDDEAFERR